MTANDQWVDLIERLARHAYSVLGTADICVSERGGGDIKLLGAALLARTLGHVKAVLILAKVSMPVEARTLVRCCFENELWIGGLIADGDAFAERMVHDESRSRQSRGELLFAEPTTRETLTGVAGERLREWLRESKNEFPASRLLHPKGVAENGSLLSLYHFYGQLSGDAAHPSLEALNRHMIENVDGEITGMNADPPPRPGEIEDTYGLCCLALLGTVAGMNAILGNVVDSPELQSLAQEYKRLI